MIDLKTLMHKTSVDLKLMQLEKMRPKKKEKSKAPELLFPVFREITSRITLLFIGESTVVPVKLKRLVLTHYISDIRAQQTC